MLFGENVIDFEIFKTVVVILSSLWILQGIPYHFNSRRAGKVGDAGLLSVFRHRRSHITHSLIARRPPSFAMRRIILDKSWPNLVYCIYRLRKFANPSLKLRPFGGKMCVKLMYFFSYYNPYPLVHIDDKQEYFYQNCNCQIYDLWTRYFCAKEWPYIFTLWKWNFFV